MITCSLQPNFAKLTIGSLEFYLEADDLEIDRSVDQQVINVVSRSNIAIPLTVGTIIVKAKLYSSGEILTDTNTVNQIKTFQRNQYQALLNSTTVPYVSFTGFGVSFNQGIIISCYGEKGIMLSPSNCLYDYIAISIHTNKREWV